MIRANTPIHHLLSLSCIIHFIMFNKAEVTAYLESLQCSLAAALAAEDGGAFVTEDWQSDLGSGRTMALADGKVFERAGVNYSAIAADRLPPAAVIMHPDLVGKPYQAGGVSVVVHPQNPYCPTAHLNVRFFTASEVWWFGGGMDLTPHYGFAEDCRHFHATCRDALDAHDKDLYPRFKKHCDEYFYLRHRGETRGVGGVFFDHYDNRSFAHAFAVTRAIGDAFTTAYLPIIQKRRATDFGTRQREWQQHRRGRYVEFNLLYDRGTLFGLQSGGRTEAILMSLPPAVRWGRLSFTPTAEEESLSKDFLLPREWV